MLSELTKMGTHSEGALVMNSSQRPLASPHRPLFGAREFVLTLTTTKGSIWLDCGGFGSP